MLIRDLKVIQHNVLKWTSRRKNELTNFYLREDPDIILMNSTGIPDNEKIKVFTYNVYQINKQGEENAGVAIAIKNNIKHQLLDDFHSNFLAIRLDTTRGPLIAGTTYSPPRYEAEFPIDDINNVMRRSVQVLLAADLNAAKNFNGY